MIELKIKAVSPLMGTKFPLPAYATAGAAAMDLCACMEEPVTLAWMWGLCTTGTAPTPASPVTASPS